MIPRKFDYPKSRFLENSDISQIVLVSTLHLRIISGTDLPKPRGAGSKGSVIDPYVLIEVFGAATDCAEHRTRTVHNCGRNPVFDETCEFRLAVPGKFNIITNYKHTARFFENSIF